MAKVRFRMFLTTLCSCMFVFYYCLFFRDNWFYLICFKLYIISVYNMFSATFLSLFLHTKYLCMVSILENNTTSIRVSRMLLIHKTKILPRLNYVSSMWHVFFRNPTIWSTYWQCARVKFMLSYHSNWAGQLSSLEYKSEKIRRSPYGPVLKITPFSVVYPNLSHLRIWVHENLALGLFFGPL